MARVPIGKAVLEKEIKFSFFLCNCRFCRGFVEKLGCIQAFYDYQCLY